MAYQVVAPLVITKNEDRSDLYLYFGAILPDHVSADEIERLTAGKFIEDLSSREPAKSAAKSSKPSAPSN